MDDENIYEEMNRRDKEEKSNDTEEITMSNSKDLTDLQGEAEEVAPAKIDFGDMDLGDLSVEDNGDDEDNILSSEEKLHIFSDQIIASCIDGKEICQYARDKMMSITNPRLFRDENYILFSIYYAYRSKLRVIKIDEEFIRLYLNRNRDILTKARGYIDVHAYGEVEGSDELGYISGVLKHFNRLKGFSDISVEDFETYFEKYIIEFKAVEANKVYRQAQVILTEGLKVGRHTLFGFEDSQSYCRKKLAEIEGLVDHSKGSGFVKQSEVILEEKPDNKKPILIGDFGRLKPLNEAYHGIFTGTFYSFIAPPKSGKTKLCARLCHNIMLAGNNISVWAREGGTDAWVAQMRAIHFDYTYNEGADLLERKFGVSQEVILHDTFKTDELRQLEMSSKIDLATNMDYGSIDYIDRPFNVETFLDDIETSVRENNSKAVFIDYLQLIGSSSGLSERECIAEAYKRLLNFCRDNNVAVISPAQYKQEAFNDMIKRTSTDSADLRTAAGGSSEVLRTPDVLWALWATVDDIRNNSMKIIALPSRMNVAFPNVNVRIDLATCQFISVD